MREDTGLEREREGLSSPIRHARGTFFRLPFRGTGGNFLSDTKTDNLISPDYQCGWDKADEICLGRILFSIHPPQIRPSIEFVP